MKEGLDELVRKRAEYRCEYCHFPEGCSELPFQLDHIVARQHGGAREMQNLALACCFCNRHKGPNLSGVDPQTRQIVPLFNPRQQNWNDHFAWHGTLLTGKTETGRATVQTLCINRTDALAVRRLLLLEGNYPA